jgi:hypothetical protein
MSPPNEVYTAFSFIGFVLCAIPLYWHLEGNVEVRTCWSTHSKIVRPQLGMQAPAYT